MKYCILASGSRGNSIYVEGRDTRLLIDVGLSAREIENRLRSKNLDPAAIDAVILTHAHNDHVKGVGVFANRYKIPVYGHPETLDGITRLLKPGQKVQATNGPFQFRSIHLTPFRVPHDCEPTHGFLVQEDGRVLAICTDLGYVTPDIRAHLKQAHALILESNHDPEMLMGGPYPFHLKDRIAGRTGHLSNHNAGELLQELIGPHIRQVVLGHLSNENNTPELALNTVRRYISPEYHSRLSVIEQRTVSEVYHL
ncbi:MAG: MBL fold metallo-hydrolase [Calditrichaeota bacterium]|nr:MBL fold metallo-hydrolase [Calditrichota bacterium]